MIPSLTGVRGIAALWVLLFHVQGFAARLGVAPLGGAPILRSGWTGVDLFFVLSGFVLMLVHEQDFRALQWPTLWRFGSLRVLRVYPLATVVLLYILLLTLVDRGFAADFNQGAYPRNLTLSAFLRTLSLATRWWFPTDGDWNQPVWSLSVEIIGYCALPLLGFVATRISNWPALVALALLSLYFPTAYAFVTHGKPFNDDLFWGAPVRMAGAFTAGIILCRLHRVLPAGLRVWQGRVADAGVVLLLVSLGWSQSIGFATICFGMIVFGLASGQGMANAAFASAPAVLLGRLSFAVYLLHVMTFEWLMYGLDASTAGVGERVLGLVLALGFIFGFAWLLHLWVEQPAHRLARRLTRRPTTSGELAPAPAKG